MRRGLAVVVAAAVLAGAALAVDGMATLAQTVSPMISPGRIHVESPVGQGQRVELPPLAVMNHADESAEVRMSLTSDAGDAAIAEGSTPYRVVPEGWLRFSPSTFALAAGEGRAVSLWLDVLRSAQPGEYRARLHANVTPPSDAGGIAVVVRAAVATELRFSIEERHHRWYAPLLALGRQYGLGAALALGAGAVTFGVMEIGKRYRFRVERRG
jgi:hypothetical protein